MRRETTRRIGLKKEKTEKLLRDIGIRVPKPPSKPEKARQIILGWAKEVNANPEIKKTGDSISSEERTKMTDTIRRVKSGTRQELTIEEHITIAKYRLIRMFRRAAENKTIKSLVIDGLRIATADFEKLLQRNPSNTGLRAFVNELTDLTTDSLLLDSVFQTVGSVKKKP